MMCPRPYRESLADLGTEISRVPLQCRQLGGSCLYGKDKQKLVLRGDLENIPRELPAKYP